MINKLLVKKILEQPLSYKWSLQGFGMLRLYLSSKVRLHVWTNQAPYKVPGVSIIHTHPWDFTSEVVAGMITNTRYKEIEQGGRLYNRQLLQCGPGGCLKDEPDLVHLSVRDVEQVHEGDIYTEAAEEIHHSEPEDGTVTIVRRIFKSDTEHAYVYWPVGEEWGSAEPREATSDEINHITGVALNRWFRD